MDKLCRLQALLKRMGSVLVAFSGGVDSAFLAAVAHKTLGSRASAITVSSPFVPAGEIKRSAAIARSIGISHRIERRHPPVQCWRNGIDRCYACKKALFTRFLAAAREQGRRYVVEGSNLDDMRDFRPGSRALRDLGVMSPLQKAGFTKSDIRRASRRMGLVTWNMESAPCLATRFQYGVKITRRALSMVEAAEAYLRRRGLSSVRVRCDGAGARIEVDKRQIPVLIKKRNGIARRLRALGFIYVSLDLEGYRRGSLNEAVPHG